MFFEVSRNAVVFTQSNFPAKLKQKYLPESIYRKKPSYNFLIRQLLKLRIFRQIIDYLILFQICLNNSG
jgi:hypothetical protein